MDLQHLRRIYLRAPNWVGDFVMATAAFERLRAGFPQAEISVALRPYLRPLLSGSEWFDRVLEAPKKPAIGSFRQQLGELRAGNFDLAVVLPNSFVTGVLPFLARVPMRLGYQQGRPGLMTHGLRAEPGRPLWSRRGPRRLPIAMPLYYERLLDLLELPPGRDRGVLAVTDAERAWLEDWLRERNLQDKKLLLITAGASYGASKLWLPERFAAVARHYHDRGEMAVVVTAGPSEVALADKIAEEGGCVSATNPVLPLDMMKALVERSCLMITSDTGPRHLAVAFDRPVVCLMGPSDPRYTEYGLDKTALIRRAELDCVPCQRKICPLGHHDCMRGIGVEEVIAATDDLLARFP
ncbi:MAG: lipopolysaccharide heptosyltransferase II [Planctomycetota bacterium]